MRLRNAVAILVIVLVLASTCIQTASALPPLENGISFPAGTFVIPMDEKQADRILVFGFVHALVYENVTLFRVIEPPNVTLSTNMTASPAAFYGGPFLVYSVESAKVAQVRSEPDFKHVTVGQLTAQVTLNNIFRVTEPTKILVVKGEPPWGKTDVTLDDMNIPYTIVTHEDITANPNMIFNYTLIVIDCNGWEGHIPSQIADNIRSQVSAGHEVIFTDRALADLNATFPGYVNVSGAEPTDRISNAYAYNPPRKYDPTKYGASADRLEPEFPSQYYNPGPFANNIKVYTESQGYVVSSVPSARVNDVRILADSNTFGTTNNQYAIFAFYFEYGNGIVEGLAFHPQQQTIPTVGNNGYYGVYQLYGNKFVESPPIQFFTLESNPISRTVYQGDSTTYTITVRSFAGFNLPVTLAVTSDTMPPGATASFNPPSPQPPANGMASSVLTMTTSTSTPVGSYSLNVTGTDTSSPPTIKWIIVTLTVMPRPANFGVCVSPNLLKINVTDSKTAIVTVTSIGTFSQNVTLSVTGLPAHVTATFTPAAPQPLPGSTASSVMRISVGADAINGTYYLTIVGSNGTCGPKCTRYTTSPPCGLQLTLVIVKPPAAAIPWLTLLLILLAALAGVILGLLAYALSRGRPVGPSGLRYVVPATAQRMRCSNCGNPIALDAVYCPFCGRRRGSPVAIGVVGHAPTAALAPRRAYVRERRAVWGFVLAMIGGILILSNTIALLSPWFWGPPTGWSSVFWWLSGPSGLGQPLAVLIGLIAGLIVITGGIMMVMRRGPIGAMITLPFAVVSFVIGGGFIAGAILGIVAGILGLLKR